MMKTCPIEGICYGEGDTCYIHDMPEAEPKEKLYVLVRADLSIGQQMAQAAHAGIELQRGHDTPETIVILNVKDEDELLHYYGQTPNPFYLFYEPDYNEYTALSCVSRGDGFISLRLAGRESKLQKFLRKIMR